MREFLEASKDLQSALKSVQSPLNVGTSGVHFHGSAGLSILSYVAIITAIAAVLVVSAWRSADLSTLSDIKAAQAELEAQLRTDRILINRLEQKITILESKNE